jgi:exosortase
MSRRATTLGALALVFVAFGVLYRDVAVQLVQNWGGEDFSHGFLIVPIALFFAWDRRSRLAQAVPRPSNVGLLLVVASVSLLVAGVLGAAVFLARLSMLGVLAGIVLYLYGWRHLRLLAFPIAFLVLMIPIPTILFNQIAFPLQLVASRFGELALTAVGIPVLREGNVITLSNTSLEVAEACSGIRSLVSLLTLAIVLGYLSDRRAWTRAVVAVASIPVAIVANGVRVAAAGIGASRFGPEAAQGVLHTFSGWLVFVVATILLVGIQGGLVRLFPDRHRETREKEAA